MGGAGVARGHYLVLHRGLLLHLKMYTAALAPQDFVDHYLLMVRGCAERDAETVVQQSIHLGFLTGGPVVGHVRQYVHEEALTSSGSLAGRDETV